MNSEQKRKYFQMLVELGYKEIEISFPSSGQTDWDFTRELVTTPGAIPDDVWIQVMTPCRKDLIDQTLASVRGAKNVILHLYIATSHCFQSLILGKTHSECKELAVECTKYCRSLTKDSEDSGVENWTFQFSPEAFSDSDLDKVIDICDAVKDIWEPTEQEKMILNLPATVELSTPNVLADQVEYFCTHIARRETVVISLHPHNDRGCAIAAAELSQMAGAERVEGTLFGNGERTGNVDHVTLALNLYTQGISPGLDFSNLDKVRKIVESINNIPVPARWPYAGSLVTSAFSGAHQDAIKKGMNLRSKQGATYSDHWLIPYLPWDPQDFGRTYEAIIRVNSQSGKGGVSWIIQQKLGLDLPRGLSIEFSKIVQRHADLHGRELMAYEICDLFEKSYKLNQGKDQLRVEYPASRQDSGIELPLEASKKAPRNIICEYEFSSHWHSFHAETGLALSAFQTSLKSQGLDMEILECSTKKLDRVGAQPENITFIKSIIAGSYRHLWALGISEDPVQSALIAFHKSANLIVC